MGQVKESYLNNIPFQLQLDPNPWDDSWEELPEEGTGCAGGRIHG